MANSQNSKEIDPGVLFLVVGPSGVGKDSIIEGAQNTSRVMRHTFFPGARSRGPLKLAGKTIAR